MKSKTRKSGLELLRILCIILIIAHHYSVHGGYPAPSWKFMNNGRIFVQELAMFGRMSCSIFALISGFFLIRGKAEVSRQYYGKLIPLVAEMLLYSVGIWLVMSHIGVAHITLREGLRAFLPVITGNWYVVYYLVIFLLTPFLNPFLQSLDRKKFTQLVVFLLVIWSVIPTLTHIPSANPLTPSFANLWWYDDFDFFVIMYIFGAYIGLHLRDRMKYANYWNLLAMLASAACLLLSVWLFDQVGIAKHSDNLVMNANYLMTYNSIPAVICAVSAFLFFERFEFRSRLINTMAGSVLGIYLIHDNDYVRQYIWQILSPNAEQLRSPYLHACGKIMAVFAVCLVIDLVQRATFGRLVKQILNRKNRQVSA